MLLVPSIGGVGIMNVVIDGCSFDDTETEYMQREATTSQSNPKKGTIALWWKPIYVSSAETWIEFMGADGTNVEIQQYSAGLWLRMTDALANSHSYSDFTNEIFKAAGSGSPSAYFLMTTWDTTQATAANRLRFWIGSFDQVGPATEKTTWPDQHLTNVAQNTDIIVTGTNSWATVGRGYGGGSACNGNMGDVYFLDGIAITDPDVFAKDLRNGLRPVTYSGPYGNAGFHLDFASSAAMGNDAGPNNLDFTLYSIDSGNHVDSWV